MRALSERDQCQAKLDILVEGFMGDDWGAYREACGRSEKYPTRPPDARWQVVHA